MYYYSFNFMLALFDVAGALRVVDFGGFAAAVWLCWLVVVVCGSSWWF